MRSGTNATWLPSVAVVSVLLSVGAGCRLGFELSAASDDGGTTDALGDDATDGGTNPTDARIDPAGSDAAVTPPVDAAIDAPGNPPGCPPGYTLESNGSCYRLVTNGADWLTAELDCEDDATGSHLVVVDNATENNMLPDYAWIGLTERVGNNGEFITVTGLPMPFDGFASGEPAPRGGACTVTRPDGWHDDICAEVKDYVCEFDGIAADMDYY